MTMHTVTRPADNPADRPPLPPPDWAVIDAWEATLGLPPDSRPLP